MLRKTKAATQATLKAMMRHVGDTRIICIQQEGFAAVSH
jgi:hypothetical protein